MQCQQSFWPLDFDFNRINTPDQATPHNCPIQQIRCSMANHLPPSIRSVLLRARDCYYYVAKMSVRSSSEYSLAKPFSAIPGPKPVPFFGNMKLGKEISEGKVGEEFPYTKLAKEYGDIFKVYFMNKPFVVLSNADAVKKVLGNEGKIPVRSTMMEKNVTWVHHKSKMPIAMVMSHKNDWKRLRSAMIKQVVPRRLVHFTVPMCSVANELCDHIKEIRSSDGWVEDIWGHMQSWALKGATRVVFNEDIDAFSGKNPQATEFVEAALAFIRSLGEIGRALPLYKIYPTKAYKEYVENYSRIRRLGKKLLNNHYEKLLDDVKARNVDTENAVGILDQWLIEGKLTEEEAIVQACDMLGAGIDTTSNTGTFLLHELAKNPDIQDAVYKEIADIVGPHENPTSEQLQRLSLVRKCVKETLRLYPLIPLMSREVSTDTVILGYQIPAGTCCIFNQFMLSKDPRYFNDPLKFDPDRWSHDVDQMHPFASLPFGFGPRMCYGRRIAELELHVVATRILQNFKISTDQKAFEQSVLTVLHPNEPVRIKFTDYKE